MVLQKSRWGTWLLLSLIPNGFVGFISFAIYMFTYPRSGDLEGWPLVLGLCMVYLLANLVARPAGRHCPEGLGRL